MPPGNQLPFTLPTQTGPGTLTTQTPVLRSLPPSLVTLSQTTYGKTIPIALGDRRITGTFLWGRPIYQDSTGAYFADFAVSFGYSWTPNAGRSCGRIWADTQLIYDSTVAPVQRIQGLNFTFYPGSETQGEAPTIYL